MRPLSFTGIVSSQESTRVTEAASLESRVKDLERQVATLKNFISDYLDTRPKTSATAARRSEPVHSLLPAFEEKKDRPRRYSFTSIDHTVTDKLSPPRVDPDRSSSYLSVPKPDNDEDDDDSPHPDNNSSFPPSPRGLTSPSHSAKRKQEPNRISGLSLVPTEPDAPSAVAAPSTNISLSTFPTDTPTTPTMTLSVSQYTGLVTMIKREQGARRKLENQIATLQEQMSLLLHMDAPPPPPRIPSTDALQLEEFTAFPMPPQHHHPTNPRSLASSRAVSVSAITIPPRDRDHELAKKASREMPTPELTPPRQSTAGREGSVQLPVTPMGLGDSFGVGTRFSGFDGEGVGLALGGEEVDGRRGEGVQGTFYLGVRDSTGSEWDDAAEELSGDEDEEEEEGAGGRLDVESPDVTRTLSLSEFTAQKEAAMRG